MRGGPVPIVTSPPARAAFPAVTAVAAEIAATTATAAEINTDLRVMSPRPSPWGVHFERVSDRRKATSLTLSATGRPDDGCVRGIAARRLTPLQRKVTLRIGHDFR